MAVGFLGGGFLEATRDDMKNRVVFVISALQHDGLLISPLAAMFQL